MPLNVSTAGGLSLIIKYFGMDRTLAEVFHKTTESHTHHACTESFPADFNHRAVVVYETVVLVGGESQFFYN